MLIESNPIPISYVEHDQYLDKDVGLSIKGLVKELSIPLPCRVRLFHKQTGRLIYDVATSKAGEYEFNKLLNTQYFIIAHHPRNELNAVIQDNVVPK